MQKFPSLFVLSFNCRLEWNVSQLSKIGSLY